MPTPRLTRRHLLLQAPILTAGLARLCAHSPTTARASALTANASSTLGGRLEAARPQSTRAASTASNETKLADEAEPRSSLPHSVAIGACASYTAGTVESAVRQLVSLCGGLGDIVQPGDTVVIKPNLTGAGRDPMPDGTPAILSYTTHPSVTRAIGKLALEAGASRIILTEGRSQETWTNNEYTSIITELGAEVLEVNQPAPGADYAWVPVGTPLALDHVWLNEVIASADVFISVPKLKCHASAGFTGAIKNVLGCTPTPRYTANPGDTYRSGLHSGDWSVRLPKIIVDIVQARPIDFCVVDAIATIDQGEGPWNDAQPGIVLRCVQPELLMAGRNALAVDAVCAAVMGFDPEAPGFTSPFLCGLNYLSLAASVGLGSHRLQDIAVQGLSIQEASFPFTPCPAAGSSEPTATPEPTETPSPTATVEPAGRRAYLPIIHR